MLAAALARNSAVASGTTPVDRPFDQVSVEPLSRALGAESRPLFAALLVAAAFLVAIAALNASSLMAARTVDRRHELAVRRALGASSLDIGRLLLSEAVLLVSAGSLIGLIAAVPLLRFVARLLPNELALFKTVSVDWRIVAFSLASTAVLAVTVALWSLRLSSRGDSNPGQARGVAGQARSLSWRLVATLQVALAFVLTVGGSLLVGSLLSVYAQSPPIKTNDILTVSLQFLGTTSRHCAKPKNPRIARPVSW